MRLHAIQASLVAVLALSVSACSTATRISKNVAVGEEIEISRTSFSFDKDKPRHDVFPMYRIKPDDVLDVLYQIRTWIEKEDFKLAADHTLDIRFVHAPELDQKQRIRPDGTVTLPYIGEISVVGKHVAELTKELKASYAKILKVPELYVYVSDFRSAIKELKADLHTAPRGLSRLVTVRPDGYVTFPMLGDTFVAGQTIAEVNAIMNEKYEKLMPGLHCDLFLEKHTGTLVYLVGEVNKPGPFEITKPITLLEALSLAGSYTSAAELDSVMVVRNRGEKLVATRVDLKSHLDFSSKSAFVLEPDDIVIVPRMRLSESAQIAGYIGDIIFFRGWSIGFNKSLDIVR
jgi:polysaccharide biosynthesis/export protein